jgi:hypothetical protein
MVKDGDAVITKFPRQGQSGLGYIENNLLGRINGGSTLATQGRNKANLATATGILKGSLSEVLKKVKQNPGPSAVSIFDVLRRHNERE